VREALVTAWAATDRPCGKRLAPFLAEVVPNLERHGVLTLSPEVRGQLLGLSAATIDRLLQPERQRHGRRPATHRAAGAGVRAQIPLRTFREWAGATPGALQADLVAHCGASTHGFYLTTLLAVDVATGWTEVEAVWGKGQVRVHQGIRAIRERLPMALRALHTNNGGEFINHLLAPWCQTVALTIDTEVHPPKILLIRGRAELDVVDGIPDEYLQMNGTYQMTPEQRVEWEAEVRSLYDGMVRIVVAPTWAKLIDFETTLPSAVEELVRQREERQRG
jgi:hypothetical protein